MLHNNPRLKALIAQLWNSFWSGGISNPLTAIEQITYLLFMKRLDDLEAKREADAAFTGEKYVSRFDGFFFLNKADYDSPVDESNLMAENLGWLLKQTKGEGKQSANQEELLTDTIREIAFGTQVSEVYLEIVASAFSITAKEFKARNLKDSIPKQTLRWSYFNRMPAEEMLLHVQTKVFPFLKELNGHTSPFTRHMANAVFIIPKPSLLVEAVKTIEAIFEVIEADASEGGQSFQDIQGDVYEMLLGEIASAGKNGQFRTPRHIIKLMADLVKPQLGQKVLDPACGTGGFLLGAYQYILTDLVRQKDASRLVRDEDGFERGTLSAFVTEDVKKILEKSFYGYDIDQTMVRLGLMNLMMHGIDEPQIDYQDTLSKKYNEEGAYDIVMANPPFTGNIDKGDINESLKLPTTKTELLFLERIFRMLKTGGTAAVIIPQGVLFGAARAFVEARKILVEECELKAVITLPSGVFKPYAGVSTAILIFTKGGETRHTWFYQMDSDGYTLDDKRNKQEGYGDLQDIVQQYNSRDPLAESDRKAKYFFVPKAEIVEKVYDLSLNKYKEEVYDEVEYEAPKIILEKLDDIEKEIINGLASINSYFYE